MEDVFEETARVEEGEAQQKSRERNKAIEQSRRTAKTLENCQWCLDSRQMLKHLIVAIGSTVSGRVVEVFVTPLNAIFTSYPIPYFLLSDIKYSLLNPPCEQLNTRKSHTIGIINCTL